MKTLLQKSILKKPAPFLFTLLMISGMGISRAQVSLPLSSPYLQNFDSIPGISGISYPEGWVAYNGNESDSIMNTGSGSSATGANYNYGSKIGLLGSGANFLPGAILLHIANTSGKVNLKISYDVIKMREQGRSNSFNLEISTTSPTSGFAPVTGGAYASNSIPENTVSNYMDIDLAALDNINGSVYIRWSYTDISGSGSRDGVALDNVEITWNEAGASILTTSVTALTGLDYIGSGPSAAQSFILSGSDLDGSDVTPELPLTSAFEISEYEGSNYSAVLTLSAYDGADKTIYARLKSGLAAGNYNDIISLSGGGATGMNVSVSGSATAPPANAGLFISEYIKGTSDNKYIEIYNGTGTAVDLSDYTIALYANGAMLPSNTQNLGQLLGTLPSGGVMVLRHNFANIHDSTIITYGSPVCNFNGNDAIVLKNNGVIIDIFGQTGCDPGTAWTAPGGFTTLDKTLIRNPEVCSGIAVNPADSCNAGSFPALATEWSVLPLNTVSNLGIHTTNCTMPPVSPVISLGAVSSGACVNVANMISVAYSAAGFEGAPAFTAQLSDASGNFTTPTASNTGSSPIILSVPANVLSTGNYSIRVISGTTSSDTAVFVAHSIPGGSITALNGSAISDVLCPGTEAIVNFTANTGLAPFILTLNDGNVDFILENINAAAGIPSEIPIEAGILITKTYTLTKIQDANGCTIEE